MLAREWVDEHVLAEAQYFGNALVLEHRYARDLASGMVAGGLLIS